MLIATDDFYALALDVSKSTLIAAIAIDFETTGLSARSGDKAFIIGVCIDGACFSYKLGGTKDKEILTLLLSNTVIRYLAHNAKFEMTFLKEQWDVEIQGHIWDTEVMARLQCNNHISYSLQACAERLGETKYPAMLAWLKDNKHGYCRASDELIVPYVEHDARLSHILYKSQCDTFRQWQDCTHIRISGLVQLEMGTTKNLFRMESAGLRLNVPYCTEAYAYELNRAEVSELEFQCLTGVKFIDSAKTLRPLFDANSLKYDFTEKGNPSFDYESLRSSRGNPIVDCVLEHREALKRASTYWKNFLKMHIDGTIYPNIRQSGAASGRFSANNPNVQNWPDDSEDLTCAYPIRRAFIARPGHKLISMDYAQMELRLIADEANEIGLIEGIQQGVDFHQQVADVAQTTRGTAKAVRFAKLYGAGTKKIAAVLNVPLQEATRICAEIDRSAPNIMHYSDSLIQQAKVAGFGYNWIGRRFFFERNFEYKYPNYRIQGGCADILRVALRDIGIFLRSNAHATTRYLIPIHDEIVFDWDERDMYLIEMVKQIMIDAAKSMRRMKMDVSVSEGQNLHDMESI
jgi:DNA polymerase I-like protein with 3'-5' exonuclease and polymerase domains